MAAPEVQALGVPQLTPELAAAMAAAETVFFVDARRDAAPSGVHVEPLEPPDEAAFLDGPLALAAIPSGPLSRSASAAARRVLAGLRAGR